MFAVVEIKGKQYTVTPGSTIEVDTYDGEAGKTVKIDKVLLISDEGKAHVGQPTVKGAYVSVKILNTHKGEKVEVRRFKSKVRERKKRGFRPTVTTLEVQSIHTA